MIWLVSIVTMAPALAMVLARLFGWVMPPRPRTEDEQAVDLSWLPS